MVVPPIAAQVSAKRVAARECGEGRRLASRSSGPAPGPERNTLEKLPARTFDDFVFHCPIDPWGSARSAFRHGDLEEGRGDFGSFAALVLGFEQIC